MIKCDHWNQVEVGLDETPLKYALLGCRRCTLSS